MPVRLRNFVLFLLLAAVAATSWLLRPLEPLPDSAVEVSDSALRYYINDAVFSGLDDDGRIIYRMAAARIEGFGDSRMLNLDDVEIRYAPDLNVPWLITAATARSGGEQDFLELSGVIIEADDLRLEPKQQFASTPGPVRFSVGASIIDAVGLTADLRAERFSLESGVYGHVAP